MDQSKIIDTFDTYQPMSDIFIGTMARAHTPTMRKYDHYDFFTPPTVEDKISYDYDMPPDTCQTYL